MPPADLLARGEHTMTVCNSCRYCEQYCPVFPAMERRGVPRAGGPIDMMLMEHEQGRAFVRAMAEAAGRYAQGDKSAVPALSKMGAAMWDCCASTF